MALIYIFKYPQPGQEDGIFNPSTGSAREEDMAIAMSQFLFPNSLVVAQWKVGRWYVGKKDTSSWLKVMWWVVVL